MTERPSDFANPPPPETFRTTQWTVVRAAGGDDSQHARRALADLCQAYWYPLYAFVRRRGYSPADAEDLTQEFFVRLLDKKDTIETADPERGRFRSYLRGAMTHFLANQRDRARAAKRGGGAAQLQLDYAAGESRYRLEPSTELTAEKLFERNWALTVLEQVLTTVRAEYVAAGRESLFERLKFCLTGGSQQAGYRQLAEELQMTEGALKVAVYRLRRRYHDRLRQQIAETISQGKDLDSEIDSLFRALEA